MRLYIPNLSKFILQASHKLIPLLESINPLKPNDLCMSRTAPLASKRCILYIYSTNIGTEYFKHALYSPFFFSLQNAVCFIMLNSLVPVLFTFYIQDVLKLKKNNSGTKGLSDKPVALQERRFHCSAKSELQRTLNIVLFMKLRLYIIVIRNAWISWIC